MPIESDAGTKGAFERKPAQTAEVTQQAAAPEPAVDEEKVRLRQEAEQAKQALQEIAGLVQSGKLRLVNEPQQAAPPQEEDETALVDRKELKKLKQELVEGVSNAFMQTTSQTAAQLREANMELLRPKLKNFEKYEKEVDALLQKMDPRLASRPETIKQVYQVVRSGHMEEEIEAEVASRIPAQESEADEGGWEADFVAPESAEPVERVASRAPQRQAARPSQGGVAPAGDASASRPAARGRQIALQPISREERQMAEIFGIKSADEWRKYGDPNWRPDMTGFKGRSRV